MQPYRGKSEKDAILQCYDILKKYEESSGSCETNQITSLFIAKLKDDVSLVQKHRSGKRMGAFPAANQQGVGKQIERGAFQNKTATVSSLFEQAMRSDDAFFDQAAETLGIQPDVNSALKPGQIVREQLYRFGVQFKLFEESLEAPQVKKSSHTLSYNRLSIPLGASKTAGVGLQTFDNLRSCLNHTSDILQPLLAKYGVTPHECDEITFLLTTTANFDSILNALQQTKEMISPELLNSLRLTLMKGLAFVSNDKADTLLGILDKISSTPQQGKEALNHRQELKEFLKTIYDDPFMIESILTQLDKNAPQLPKEDLNVIRNIEKEATQPAPIADRKYHSLMSLKTFALIFGDPFIQNSGLEGDFSSHPYADLIGEYIESQHLNTPWAKEIEYLVKNPIDLRETAESPHELKNRIKEILRNNPHENKRCLLMGGWHKHAIVYLIEKQRNGEFTFRIFNTGAGSEIAEQLQEKYHTKVAGSIGVMNVKKKRLFNSNFLGCLKALNGVEKLKSLKPQQLLVYHYLPLLGGDKALTDPRVEHFLLGQRSGTCPYRSLRACLTHMMLGEEFIRFEVEFKIFMLDRYLPALIEAHQKPIENWGAYEELRLAYATIKRSVQDFAGEVEKQRIHLSDEKVKRVQQTLLRYEVELVKLDRKILDYEKTIYRNHLEFMNSMNPVKFETNLKPLEEDQKVEPLVINSINLHKETLEILDIIHQIPANPNQSTFSSCVEMCLLKMAHSSPEIPENENFYLMDCFYKKIGSLSNLDGIHFQDPSQAILSLNTLAGRIAGGISTKRNDFRAERYLIFLSTTYALERAFSQCTDHQRVVDIQRYSSLLTSKHAAGHLNINNHLKYLCCSDPYWTLIRAEMIAKQDPNSYLKNQLLPILPLNWHEEMQKLKEYKRSNAGMLSYEFSTPDENRYIGQIQKKRLVELSKQLQADICNWWFSKQNKELRRKAEESIKQDRITQELEIKENIKKAEDRKHILLKDIETLKDHSKKVGNESFRKNVYKGQSEEFCRDWIQSELKKNLVEIDGINLAIVQGIANSVKNNSKYWPQGFEGGTVDFSDSKRATFLFAEQEDFFKSKLGISDPLPREFRIYCHYTLLSANIFEKNDMITANTTSYPFRYTKEGDKISDYEKMRYPESEGFTNKEIEHDIYIPNIKEEPIHGVYCSSIFRTRPEESKIPYIVSRQKDSKIDQDELAELYAIRSNAKLQIDNLLSYFEEHMDKMAGHSWVNYFHSQLFDSNILLNELRDPHFSVLLIPRLQRFFNLGITNAMSLEDYATAANFAWIAANAQKYVDEGSTKPQAPLYDKALLVELAEMAFVPKFEGQWHVIAEALLAINGTVFLPDQQSENIDEKLLIYTSFAHLIRQRHAPGTNMDCLPRHDQADKAVILLQKYFSQKQDPHYLCSLMNKFGVTLLSAIYPSLGIRSFSSCSTQGDQYESDNGFKISLTMGRLQSPDSKDDRVYNSIVDSATITNLKKVGLYPENEDLSRLRCFSEKGILFIHDSEKNLYFEFPQFAGKIPDSWSDGVSLAKRQDMERAKAVMHEELLNAAILYINVPEVGRARFIPKTHRKMAHHELRENFHHCQHKDKLYLCDPIRFKPLYRIDPKGYLTELSTGLTLGRPKGLTPLALFEDPDCTLQWQDGAGRTIKIAFPRLNITLNREIVRGRERWSLAEDNNWFLAAEQFIPHFGQDTGFIILQNDQGQKKAILPVWNPLNNETEKRSLNFPYLYNFQGKETRKGRCIECPLIDNYLVPSNHEARFYLAKIYLEKGMFDEADRLLFAHESEVTHKKHTPEESLLLMEIILDPWSKDIGAHNYRLRMHALYLHEKNLFQFPGKGITPEVDVQLKTDLVIAYLERLEEVQPLDPREELLILKRMPVVNPIFNMRKQELESMQEPVILERPTQISTAIPFFGQLQFSENTQAVEGPHGTEVSFESLEGVANWLKDKERTNPSATDEPNVPPPTTGEKLRYRYARAQGKFPFDPFLVAPDEFIRFFPLLKRECERTLSWKAGQKHELLPALYSMALSSHELVKKKALELLETHFSNKKPPLPFIDPDVKRPPKKNELPPSAAGFHSLLMLKLSFDSDIEKLSGSDLASDFFIKEQTPPLAISEDRLFNTSYPEATDATIKKQFETIANDIKKANLRQENYTLKKDVDLALLQGILTKDLKEESNLLGHRESIIVNAVASALTSDPFSHMKLIARKRELPSIEELCMVCSRKDFTKQAARLYPELSKEGQVNLQIAIKNYLLHKQHVQQIGRALQQINELTSTSERDPMIIQTLCNALGKTLEAKRAYDVEADPNAHVFLLMETVLNIILRQDQVDNIGKFAAGGQKLDNMVLQMIMGAGKTQVLQPVLAYLLTMLFADEDTLSTVMIPEFLFEPVREGLVKSLGSAFHQFVFAVPYDRELAKDIRFLEIYYDRLDEVRKRGGCLLMTPRQKHSILTSLYEAFYDLDKQPDNKDLQRRVDMISKICDLMQNHEVDQLDEIDLTMNPQVIFTYPVGVKEVVNTDRASLLSEMLVDAAFDPKLCQEISLDFINALQKRINPGFDKRGAPITENLFHSVVQPKFFAIACRLLTKRIPQFQDIHARDNQKYIRSFIMQKTPYDQKIHSLCLPHEEVEIEHKLKLLDKQDLDSVSKDSSNIQQQLIAQRILYKISRDEWIQAQFIIPDERELLGVCAEAVKDKGLLSVSLFKECGAHYGKDPKTGNYLARPYEAPNAPKPTIYRSPYEQVIYSVQQTLYEGMPADAARKMLLRLQQEAKSEMKQSSGALVNTAAYKRFTRLFGKEALHFHLLETPISDRLFQNFHHAVSKDPEMIQEYFKGYVFGQVALYKQSLSSTPQTLAGSSKLSLGYSGTLQEGILERTAKAIPEEGTNGKTITSVQSKIEVGQAEIRTYLEAKERNYPEQIIDDFVEDPEIYVYIDSGGWLKDENIHTYAEKLLVSCENSKKRKTIEGIVYHDQDGKIISLERDSLGQFIQIPLNESRFKTTEGKQLTIIAEKYETGTNILQKPRAKAIMSIRKNMTVDRGLQAMFRMRQILLGQSISFAITEELQNHMASRILDGLMKQPKFKTLIKNGYNMQEIPSIIQELSLPEDAVAIKKTLIKSLEKFAPAHIARPPGQDPLSEFAAIFEKSFVADSDSMWRYLGVNQAQTNQKNNWIAGEQKMRDVIEKPIRLTLTDSKIQLHHRLELFRKMTSFFVQQSTDSPFNQIIKGIEARDAKNAIKHTVEAHLKIIENLMLSKPEAKTEIEKNIIKLYGNKSIETILYECISDEDIAEVILLGAENAANNQELEVEIEQEQQAETTQEREVETQRIEMPLDEKPYNKLTGGNSITGYNITEFFSSKQSPFLHPLTAILPAGVQLPDGDRIQVSENLMIDRNTLGTARHGNYHLPGRYILALSRESDSKRVYILVSHFDATLLKLGISTSKLPAGCHAGLFTMDFDAGLVAGSAADLNLFHDELHQRVLVQSKLLTGKINLSNEEVGVLEKAIKSANNYAEQARKLQQMYENIIKYLPNSATRYPGSNIQKMFYNLTTLP